MAYRSVLILGAGAAGLAAGRILHDDGFTVTLLEARNRIGGRVWTDDSRADWELPIELGAEFIHGESTSGLALVERGGFSAREVLRMDNLWWSDGASPARPRTESPQAEVISGLLHDYDALQTKEADQSLAAYLADRGWDAAALQMADVILAQTCCARLDGLSCADIADEQGHDKAGKREFRINEGYFKSVLTPLAEGLDIRFNAVAERVEWSPSGGVSVTVNDGAVFHADACLITLPIAVLQRGAVTFQPPLSERKQTAIRDGFAMLPATKLFYIFKQRLWAESFTFMAQPGLTARWWNSGTGTAHDRVIACYVTADRASEMDALPESAALERGLQELSVLLGQPLETLRDNLQTAKRQAWAHDPLAGGGYAHVRVGHVTARADLAAPEGQALYFAGEAAVLDSNPQTVHGAIDSGRAAAQAIIG